MSENQPKSIHPQPTLSEISLHIRELRASRGWSLNDVEKLTHGAIKAVVMGSYERGARSLSAKRLLQIAQLFDVPVHQLFPNEYENSPQPESFMLDQRQSALLDSCPESDAIRKFITHISHARSDWNGEVLTLRTGDFQTLTLMAGVTPSQFLLWATTNRVLITKK